MTAVLQRPFPLVLRCVCLAQRQMGCDAIIEALSLTGIDMGNNASEAGQTIALPKGGGALHGIGEKFSPDLHTGTGNFTIPVALPPGRNGFQPQLNLVYSTGNGNGPFGLGWNLSIPGVSRKTSKGIPQLRRSQGRFHPVRRGRPGSGQESGHDDPLSPSDRRVVRGDPLPPRRDQQLLGGSQQRWAEEFLRHGSVVWN